VARIRFFLPILFLPLSSTGAEEKISFSREILPILSDKCYYCHGPDKEHQKADLRLDIRASAILANAIQPLHPEKSEMLIRIFSQDPEEIMPQPEAHRELTSAQKELIKKWIYQGAEYEPHWSFVTPPETIPVPETADKTWSKNPIDQFILARLEKEKLKPNSPAPPERWLRRVTFDLTGLPPTQPEIDAYLADRAPTSAETVVDRLIASPHFGERMATPWLDVARYADSFGYQADIGTEAWPYRDWVIKSLNANIPFDQFITQQLAGDLLENPTRDQHLATAFNRIHRKTNEGGSVPEEFRQDGISDRVHTVATAFMALTFECSRCHDHKFDPITAKDYYSLGAFFNSIEEAGLIQGGEDGDSILPQPSLQLPSEDQEKKLASQRSDIATAESALRNFIQTAEPEFQSWLTSAKSFPAPDLVALFHFDETSGSSLKNEIDEKKPGEIAGNQLVTGKSGNGVLSDGDNLTKLPDLGIAHADQPFSVSLWLKPAQIHERTVVFTNSSSFDLPFSGYELMLEDNHLTWTLERELPGCAASISSKTKIPANEWTHVSVTNDGSRRASGLKIFINGQAAETTVASDNLTRDFQIGEALNLMARGRDVGMKNGMVDEVAVHLRAISAAEAGAQFSGKPVSATTEPALLREYYFSAVNPTARDLTHKLSDLRAAYRTEQKGVREIVTMRESAEPVPAHILIRGDYTSIGEKVGRETPAWLPPFPADQPRNRLGFAKWLTAPNHPLTARVTINRIWQEIFGMGIVATSENFGLQGAQPSHPALLDWLARDFMNHGWDQKRAIRQMVLSATYGQDSTTSHELRERDPANALLARGPSRRLTAEMLRDSALAVSGLLSEKIGGSPAMPYQAPGSMWRVLNNFLPEYKQDTGEGLYRRSLYTYWRRTTTPPNMMIFDATTRDVCATRRQVTNTPLQPLVMLNDPQFVEAARKLGERILKQPGNGDEDRARWAYREVLGKPPASAQLSILLAIITEQREFFKSKPSDAVALLKIGDSKPDPSIDPIEAATFTTFAQSLLNLDANITLR
jgi:Protein of unknown function (DUF1553)/Protein of unknown function (DUF1549)/Concanavalin A-like lectin/glucanases superfamily/Planctomycete cytochrome C